jgi:hypothetical protein
MHYPARLRDQVDVDAAGVADGDALVYDEAVGVWVPGSSSGGGGTSPSAAAVAVPEDTSRLPGYLNTRWTWNSAAFIQQNVWTEPDGTRYAIWWDQGRKPTVGKLPAGSRHWETFDLSTVAGNPLGTAQNDVHATLTVIVDGDGLIHVAGNFHNQAWRSLRSDTAGDITAWTSQGADIGTGSHGYPTFVRVPSGDVLAFSRVGTSGNGSLRFRTWDGTAWSAQTTVLDGGPSGESPYWHRIAVDRGGRLHLFYCWRGSGNANTNNDFCYLRTDDGGTTWFRTDGSSPSLPVTHATSEVVVDTASTGSGLLNSGGADSDPSGHPHAAIFQHRNGTTQIVHVWHDGTGWQTEDVTAFTQAINLNVSFYNVAVSRPALICAANGGTLIVYRGDFDGDPGWLWGIDVTVPGQPRKFRLLRYDLTQFEPTIDSGARQHLDRLTLLAVASKLNSSDSVYDRKAGQVVTWPTSLLVDERPIVEVPDPADPGDPDPGDPDPADFPVEGLHPWFWFAADEETYADNDPVGTWHDLSGNGNHATQTSASRQPVYKTGQVNGLPAIRFASDYLDTTVAKVLRPVTAFAVVLSNNVAANGTLIGGTSGSSSAGGFQWRHNASRQNLLCEGVAQIGVSSTNLTSSQWQLWDVGWDSSGHSFGLDGTDDGSGTADTAPTSRAMRFGTRANGIDWWAGDVAEIVVVDTLLDTTDRQAVRDYLTAKYDL